MTPQELLEEAQRALDAGQVRRGIELLREAAAVAGDQTAVALRCADRLARLGAQAAAVEAYLRIADCYERDGFFLKAVAVLKQSARTQPSSPLVSPRLARIYAELGLVSDAVSELRRHADQRTRAGDDTAALEAMKQILALDPSDPDALLATGAELPEAIAVNEELERELASDPDDVDAYLVYADWLQSAADPRGELIAVQCALAAATDEENRRQLEERNAELIAENVDYLLWKLGPRLEVDWRYGFLHSVRLTSPSNCPDVQYVSLLDCLMQLPSAAVIQHLSIETEEQLRRLMDVHRPASLRELEFCPVRVPAHVDVRELAAALPHLTSLRLRGVVRVQGPLDSPYLQRLSIDMTRMVWSTRIAGFDRTGAPEMIALPATNELVAQLSEAHLPALTALTVRSRQLSPSALETLLQCSLACQVEELSISVPAGSQLRLRALINPRSIPRNLRRLELHIEANTPASTFASVDAVADVLREIPEVHVSGPLTESQVERLRLLGDHVTVDAWVRPTTLVIDS